MFCSSKQKPSETDKGSQQPHSIVCELNFYADLGDRLSGSGNQIPGKIKTKEFQVSPFLRWTEGKGLFISKYLLTIE